MTKPGFEQLQSALWTSRPGQKLWLLLDGARDERVISVVEMFENAKACLYAGKLSPESRATAPYIVQVERDDRMTRYVLEKGWGEAWGIFLHAGFSLEAVRKHLRRFLLVKDESGKRLLFRYYDPRVMRVYLPTCTADELRTIFGPITRFLMEDDDPRVLLDFSRDGDTLRTVRRELWAPAPLQRGATL